jgi:phosphatidylcholine synthase
MRLTWENKPETRKVAAAWAVHVFTGTGIVLAMLAIIAMLRGDELKAFLWLGLALFIDGIDGTLARRFRVREYTPRFDGAALDIVIDFTTYSFIPALMVYWFQMVPGSFAVAAACFIALTSLYCYANMDMKTADYYFVGFPAVWNLVVLYLYILRTPDWLNLAVIVACGILTFVPWKYVHPLRVAKFRPLTLVATVIWSATTFWLVFLAEKPEHPMSTEPVVFWLWALVSVYFAAICAVRSIDDGKDEGHEEGA